MTDTEYYTAKSLATAAGISRATFTRHQSHDVGQLSKARMKVPGLGIRYDAKKAAKYIALCAAGKRSKATP